jgi:citrate lyase beta subunit
MITRSAFNTPGSQGRMLKKKPLATVALALIFDLEDSVPAAQKTPLAGSFASNSVLLERKRGEWSPFAAHRRGAHPSLYGIVVPKVESPDSILEIDDKLGEFEQKEGVQVGRLTWHWPSSHARNLVCV